jgi:hypothetical protein
MVTGYRFPAARKGAMTDEKIIFGQIGTTIDGNIVTGRLSPDSGG